MRAVIEKYKARGGGKWAQGEFISILGVEKGLRGGVGEDFFIQMLRFAGYADAAKNEGRSSTLDAQGSFDISANNFCIEVKTASEDVHGNFQFNAIRYDDNTPYDFLFLVGISPDDIFFRIYTKSDIPRNLPPMAKGTPGTHKLTQGKPDMLPMESFADEAKKYLGESQ